MARRSGLTDILDFQTGRRRLGRFGGLESSLMGGSGGSRFRQPSAPDLSGLRFTVQPERPAPHVLRPTEGSADRAAQNIPEYLKRLGITDPVLASRIVSGQATEDDWRLATMQSTAAADAAAESAREASLARLLSGRTTIDQGFQGFLTDPDRAALREEIRRRASPEYRAIDAQAEANLLNDLAQNVARVSEAERVRAAGRGALTSGPTVESLASTRALGEAQAGRLRGEIIGRNQAAREEAFGRLAQLDAAERDLDLRYRGALAEVDRLMAAVESGYQPQPTDFLVFEALDEARRQYDDQQRFLEESLAAQESAADFGPNDFFSQVLAARGSGPLGIGAAAASGLGEILGWW